MQVDGDTKNTAMIYRRTQQVPQNKGLDILNQGTFCPLFEHILEVTQSCGSLALF